MHTRTTTTAIHAVFRFHLHDSASSFTRAFSSLYLATATPFSPRSSVSWNDMCCHVSGIRARACSALVAAFFSLTKIQRERHTHCNFIHETWVYMYIVLTTIAAVVWRSRENNRACSSLLELLRGFLAMRCYLRRVRLRRVLQTSSTRRPPPLLLRARARARESESCALGARALACALRSPPSSPIARAYILVYAFSPRFSTVLRVWLRALL